MGEDIRFGLLGSLEVTAGGQPVVLRGRRVRALLALLVLRANEAVSTERIISGLWDPEPPKAARESVHYFVHQLRKALPHADGDRQGMLERHGRGYLLRVAPETIDIVRYQDKLEHARAARGRRDHDAAWNLYAEAEELWRGPALDDLDDTPFAGAEIARLTELRLVAVEQRFTVGLALGWHDRLISDLDAQVRANPDREELRWLLMLALYRSRRQAEALDVYQDARADRAGRGEPGARLRQLQHAILTQDPPQDDLRRLDGPVPAGLERPPETSQQRDRVPRGPATACPPSAGSPRIAPEPPPAPARDLRYQPDQHQADQRKLVTVLVVGSGSDLATGGDPEASRVQTATTMRAMAERIQHYGGAVHATDLGRLLAVFGADVSHDDDPERAVRAALDITGTGDPDRSGSAARAGVATGEAVVAYSPDGPKEVVGDVVQLAVTLEQTAEAGSVAVAAATYDATSRAIGYTSVALSGALERASGIRLWRAVAPRGRTGARVARATAAQLVERDQELTILGDVLRRFLRDRQPQLVAILSEPGLGKSRLVGELARLADASPELVGWRVGHVRPYGQAAVGALAEVIRAEVGILGGDSATAARRKLNRTLTQVGLDQDRDVAEALGPLLGLPKAERPGGQQEPPFDAWARFLAAVAEPRPLVVVFEDLQWADDHLVEFVERLPYRVGRTPLLVVATSRPELLERRPRWGGQQRDAVTITLAPFSRTGVRVMLDALRGQEKLPERTREALLDAAGGNPLYVEEYVRMLAEHSGHAEGRDTAGEALGIPASVHQIIVARIDTLPQREKRLLRDAAVVGETGWAGQLAAVAGAGREEVEACLRVLERRDFLRRARVSSVAGETEYAFRHALIREAAYGQLLRADRADKHQRAAAWIERLGSGSGEWADLLAHHYEAALSLARASGTVPGGLRVRTREVLRAAADRALALGSFASAERSYEAALKLGGSRDAESLFGLAQARVYGRHGGDSELLEAAAAFEADGRAGRAAEVRLVLALNALTQGRPREADQYLQQAPPVEAPASPALAWTLAGTAMNLMIRDHRHDAVQVGERAVRVARQVGHEGAEGMALTAVGAARLKLGQLAGDAQIRQGIALEEPHGGQRMHYVRWDQAWCWWWYGDLARCAELVTAGRKAAARANTRTERWFGLLQAELDYHRGDWDAACEFLDAVPPERLGPEEGHLIPWHHLLRGRISLGRGDLQAAATAADTALELADGGDDPHYRQMALALRSLGLLLAGRERDAGDLLTRLLDEQRAHPYRSFATPEQGLVCVQLGRPASEFPSKLSPTRWTQAVRTLVRKGPVEGARRYSGIGANVDAAVAHVLAARHLAAAQPARAWADLDLARPVLEAARATGWLERLHEVERTLG